MGGKKTCQGNGLKCLYSLLIACTFYCFLPEIVSYYTSAHHSKLTKYL